MRATADATPGRLTGALLAAFVLSAWALPAAAQQPFPDTARAAVPDDPARDFWSRLRAEARQLRTLRPAPIGVLHHGPAAYAQRYRISPQLARAIHDAAEAQGIDPELAYRLVRAESGFNPRARSHAGALGLTQLMPGTARWLEPRMTTPERIMDPDANLAVGLRYLRRLLDKYDDLPLALLAYNRGEGAVDRDLRRGRNPENGYTRHVLGTGRNRYTGDGRRRGE